MSGVRGSMGDGHAGHPSSEQGFRSSCWESRRNATVSGLIDQPMVTAFVSQCPVTYFGYFFLSPTAQKLRHSGGDSKGDSSFRVLHSPEDV